MGYTWGGACDAGRRRKTKRLTVDKRGPFELRGKDTLTLRVGFAGRPLYVHRWAYQFRLDLTVDGKPLSAMASTHYICRIPKRFPPR